MAARASLDEKLAALRGLRGRALTPEQKAEVRKRIGDRSNLVVAAAAVIAGENALIELAKDLEAAFDRFLVNPLKDDKLCRAKIAIVQALDRLEHPDTDIFRRAARHVQLEPVWGGSEDSAPPLRGGCPRAGAGRGYGRPAAAGRCAGRSGEGGADCGGLGARGRRDRGRGPGPPPQGPPGRRQSRRPLRVPRRAAGGRSRGEPRAGHRIPRSERPGRLRSGGPGAGPVAPGRGARPAPGVLAAVCLARAEAAGAAAIAILRRPGAADYMMELVASEAKPIAIAALSALRIFKGDARLRERIAKLVEVRVSSRLRAGFDRDFGPGEP